MKWIALALLATVAGAEPYEVKVATEPFTGTTSYFYLDYGRRRIDCQPQRDRRTLEMLDPHECEWLFDWAKALNEARRKRAER